MPSPDIPQNGREHHEEREERQINLSNGDRVGNASKHGEK